MVLLPSSLKSRLPSFATVIPTGRPQTLPSGVTKPVTKSSYSPSAFAVNFGHQEQKFFSGDVFATPTEASLAYRKFYRELQ